MKSTSQPERCYTTVYPACYSLTRQSLLDRFVPNCECGAVFDLARLVLLYHDPELCSLLDSAKLAWREFSTTWLSSLLAADCRPEVTQQLWDILIVQVLVF